jgi:hypothetical protein
MSKQMAERYKVAEQIVWNRLAKWKQTAIKEDRIAKPDSRHLSEFAKEVVKLAESDEELVTTPDKTSQTVILKDGKFHVSKSSN